MIYSFLCKQDQITKYDFETNYIVEIQEILIALAKYTLSIYDFDNLIKNNKIEIAKNGYEFLISKNR